MKENTFFEVWIWSYQESNMIILITMIMKEWEYILDFRHLVQLLILIELAGMKQFLINKFVFGRQWGDEGMGRERI